MKKLSVVLFAILTVFITVGFVMFYSYKIYSNKKESTQILEKTYQIIQSSKDFKDESNINIENSAENNMNETNIDKNVIESKVLKEEVLLEDEILGILIIPKINITAPIKEGTSQEVMKTSIGHFTESDYWNGNVSLASHNGGTYAHYFENIKNLKENDEIEYITKLGSKKYKVKKIFNISSYDWNEVMGSESIEYGNTITLITCINGLPNYRLCVKGVEI